MIENEGEVDLASGDCCRYCYMEAAATKPLFYPCHCAGSMRYVHQECLDRWLSHNDRPPNCEVCGHRFQFQPIYKEDMPKHVPVRILLSGLGRTVTRGVCDWLHYTLVAVAWLLVVPLSAYRIYKFIFSTAAIAVPGVGGGGGVGAGVGSSMGSLLSLTWSLLSPHNLLSDVFYGAFIVSASIAAFVALVWLREQIINGAAPDWMELHLAGRRNVGVQANHPPARREANNNPNNNNNNNVPNVNEGNQPVPPVQNEELNNNNNNNNNNHNNNNNNNDNVETEEEPRDQREEEESGGRDRSESNEELRQEKEVDRDRGGDPTEGEKSPESDTRADGAGPSSGSNSTVVESEPPRASNAVISSAQSGTSDTDTGVDSHQRIDNSSEEEGRVELNAVTDGRDGEGQADVEVERRRTEVEQRSNRLDEPPVLDDIDADDDADGGSENNNGDQHEEEAAVAEDEPEPEEVDGAEVAEAGGDMFEQAAEELTWDRMLGLDGSLVFVEHVFWVISLNGIFVFLFAYCPYHLGRALSILLLLLSHFSVPLHSHNTQSNQAMATTPVSANIPPVPDTVLLSGLIAASSEATTSSQSFVAHTTTTTSTRAITSTSTMAATSGSGGTTSSEGGGEGGPVEAVLFLLLGYVAIALGSLLMYLACSILNKPQLSNIFGIMYITMKVVLLMVVEIGLFPLLAGVWIDMCTLALFDVQWAQRAEGFTHAPLTSLFIHWMVGMVFVFYYASFIITLREMLRPGVLWFLRNFTDPEFNPVHEMIRLPILSHVRRFLLSGTVFGTTCLLSLLLPVLTIRRVLPHFLPYQISLVTDAPVSELSMELLLLQVILPALLDQGHIQGAVKSSILLWTKLVGSLLGLRSYLLGDNDSPIFTWNQRRRNNNNRANIDANEQDANINNNNNNEAADNNAAAAAGGGGGLQAAHLALLQVSVTTGEDEEQIYHRPALFPLRIVGLLGMSMLTVYLLSCVGLLLPTALGRCIMSLWFGSLRVHELYTCAVGVYCCWALLRGVACVVSWMSAGGVRLQVLTHKMCNLFYILAKLSVAAVFCLGLIPLLLGLFFDLLVVMPLRLHPDQTPILFLWQSWALGILHAKIFCAVTLIGPDWWLKSAMERVGNSALANLDVAFLLRRIVMPVVGALLVLLSVPYCTAYVVVPLVLRWSSSDALLQSLIYRRFYHCLLLVCSVALFFLLQLNQMRRVYTRIKDERYLIGQRLQNLEKHNATNSSSSSQPQTTLS